MLTFYNMQTFPIFLIGTMNFPRSVRFNRISVKRTDEVDRRESHRF